MLRVALVPSQPLHARRDLHAIFASARAKFLDLESPLALTPAPAQKSSLTSYGLSRT